MTRASEDVVKEAGTEISLATMTLRGASNEFGKALMALKAIDEPELDAHGLEILETMFHMVDVSFSRYRLAVEKYREVSDFHERNPEHGGKKHGQD